MKVRGMSAAVGLCLLVPGLARGQAPATTARVETIPLELTAPDRFQLPAILEPLRRVTVIATADGVVRSMEAAVGASVRENQEIAQLDRAEAAARLRVALANVKEAEASAKNVPNASSKAVAEAQVEAAQARAEIVRLELERCTLRAPFAGRILSTNVFPGQYVAKGTTIAELADVSSLRALVPLERPTASVDATVNLSVEGQPVAAKIKATVPLPESFAPVRELATSFTAAWVVIPNTKSELEPGQRVLSSALPSSPVATVPARALKTTNDEKKPGGSMLQVIRNEYVTNVPVRVLGNPGPERIQVSGTLRATDSLIVSSTVPLLAGTLIRFNGSGTSDSIEAKSPSPNASGEVADINPPRSAAPASAPKARTTPRPSTKPAAPRTAPKAAGGTVPF